MIKVKRCESGFDLPIPEKAKSGDAGFDLRAAIPLGDCIAIPSLDSVMIPTGFSWEIPSGFEGRISPRSGLAKNHGIAILGGVVDSGYRGEVNVILANLGKEPFIIIRGDRIAQIVVTRIADDDAVELADTLGDSDRGDGGFGSTGHL